MTRPKHLSLATIELLESIGVHCRLTEGGVRVECLTTPEEIAAALQSRADQLRPPLEFRERLEHSQYAGGPLDGCQHYGRRGQVLLVQICRGRWAVYFVRPDWRAQYLGRRPSERAARAQAERKRPAAPVCVVPNPRLRPRKPWSKVTTRTERETSCCETRSERSSSA